jgi:hypothetical protein
MREKILAQLVIKFPGVSKVFLGLWADKMAKTVTEETAIEGAVSELEKLPVSISDLAAEFQKEGDRRVTEAQKKIKPTEKTEGPKPEGTTTPQDDAPAWAKTLIEKVTRLETEKTQNTLKTKAAEKLKEVPASFYAKRALPEKEEELDAFVTDVQTDFTAFKQDMANKGFAQTSKPNGSAAVTGGANNVVSDIKAWADQGKQTAVKK